MFMPEVTESIKQQGHVLRPLPWPSFVQSQDEGQLNDTRSLESWFGFYVTEAWVSRFLGLTLGDDTSYGAYKNIIPCRPDFKLSYMKMTAALLSVLPCIQLAPVL